MEAKAEEKTTCRYESCPEEALEISAEGYCIFHEKADNKHRELFHQKLQMKLRVKDYNFRGYYFIETDRKLIYYFQDYIFPKNVDFREAHFSVDTTFGNTQFLGEANFDDSKFLGNAFFDYAQFSDKCLFKNAEFFRVSSFRGTQFNKLSDFQHAKFHGCTSFPYAIFSGRAIFFFTHFMGRSEFQVTKFFKEAFFMHAMFSSDARFEDTQFLDKLNLGSVDISAFRLAGSNIDAVDLSNVQWPKDYKNIYEKTAQKLIHYKLAEQVYRKVKISYQRTGDYNLAGKFYYREMESRRKQIRFEKINVVKKLLKHISHNFLRTYCGYGEMPWKVIACSLAIVILYALLFMLSGINDHTGELLVKYRLSPWHLDLTWITIKQNLTDFWTCLYYSVITFTTLGYGDVRPVTGLSKLFSMAEAFFGAFSIALFVATFTRKVAR